MDGQDFDRLARFLGSGRSRRGVLKALGGAVLGAVGVSASARGAVAKNEQVGICHVDGQGRFRHITVSTNAVNAHLAHGDYTADISSDVNNCGACGNVCDDEDACTTNACVNGVCEYTNVPVDCVVSDWSAWGACSVECGDGIEIRTRTVTTPASCGGAACPALEESRACVNTCDDGNACTTDACVNGFCEYTNVPVDCEWGEWSDWSACDQQCGGGWQTRTREIVTPASCGGADCFGSHLEGQGCNMQACTCEDTCPDTGGCLDGTCFLAYPNCPGNYGVAANGGGLNPCHGFPRGGQCNTSSECGAGGVCILIPEGGGYQGYCYPGYPL